MRKSLWLGAAVLGVVAGMGSWLIAPLQDAGAPRSAPIVGQQLSDGLVRQVLELPEGGAAVLKDRHGADELTVVIDGAVIAAPTSGEVTNPTLSPSGKLAWAEDHERIKVWNPRTNELTSLNRPRGTTAVFSPAFTAEDTIASVAQQPVAGVPGEDEGLNNLFEVDIDDGRWTALTDFGATLTDWTALRTPVATPEGDLLFVRVRGDSTATSPPAFELWTASDEGIQRLSKLPAEMYLAGFNGDDLQWNAPSGSCDDWGLFEEGETDLELIGCGAVLADSLTAVDPDLEHEEHSDFDAPPAHDGGALAVIVGDFASRAEAVAVVGRMSDAPGQHVASHESVPKLVGPGAWIIIRPVADETSPQEGLDQVRRELPGYEAMVWLGPLDD